ncbi:MAG: hypothetical protein Ct9H90mP6_07620 [Gammaproteobacteria bacterium]|nr:MAG: hypothetical protein Ct9H90mP6_07620 [Gammaproteobacteria bacterium]
MVWAHYLANKYPNAEIFAIDILEMEEIKGVKGFYRRT